jgi:hypothetical protein
MSTYDIIVKTETIELTKGKTGFWLWDETRQMNLAMHTKTEQEAFIETIEFYQERLTEIETKYYKLKNQVDCFVNQFSDEDDD